MVNYFKRLINNTLIFFILFYFVFVFKSLAVCPLCVVFVGSGLGFSRYLGIDDTITGLWLGGLILALVMWTENFLAKKNIKFKGRTFLNLLFYYFIILWPIYYFNFLSHQKIKILNFFVDKILFGIIIGSFIFYFAISWYEYLKMKNNNKPYFPFQKVIMPVVFLLVVSLIFYFLLK